MSDQKDGFNKFFRTLQHWLRPHRTIPHPPWRAKSKWDLSLQRVLILTGGLFLFGLGEAFLVESNLGNSPWMVLSQGISTKSGLNMGWSTFYVSCAVLLLWIPLREKPGFGTLANILVIAYALQIGVDLLPLQHRFWSGLIFAVAGVGLVGIASSLYITCGLGPGPRDGLMTGLHHRTGVRVGRVRLSIEALVLLVGFALGGHLGLGTALFALFIGQAIAISFGVLSRITHQ